MNKSVKNLYDHLFEQLERLSSANKDTIDIEVKKATSMIQISEQILTAATTEVELLKSAQDLKDRPIFINGNDNNTKKLNSPTIHAVTTDENDELFVDEKEWEGTGGLIKGDSEIEEKEDNIYYPGTVIEKKPIPTDKNGNYITEEKRHQKPNQNRKY